MRAPWFLSLVMLVASGCIGSEKFAPVSGKVTLNGTPLAHATVNFLPLAKPGSIDAGESSAGKTNAQGQFTLTSSTGRKGALVGRHRVSISALDQRAGEHDTRPPRGGWPKADKVPIRYNSKSELTFDVPPGGTDKANFALTSP
jgi:hypothetical protein